MYLQDRPVDIHKTDVYQTKINTFMGDVLQWKLTVYVTRKKYYSFHHAFT